MSEIKALDKLREYVGKQREEYNNHNVSFVWQLGTIADEIEAEIADRYIKLPTDKNGNVIHVGDMVKHADGDVYEVLGVDNDGARQGVFINTGDGRYPIDSWCASGMELYKPRTVEDILCELEGLRGNGAMYEDVVTRAAILARELRELLGGDAE